MTTDKRIDKESNWQVISQLSVYTGIRNFALNKLFDWLRGVTLNELYCLHATGLCVSYRCTMNTVKAMKKAAIKITLP